MPQGLKLVARSCFLQFNLHMCCSNISLNNLFVLDPDLETKACNCPGCYKKRQLIKNSEPWRGPKNFFIKFGIFLGWAVLILLAYKVSQFDYEMANFDPYEILGVPISSSQADIKKAYRKLSLILHPDKETGNEKEFMKLTKAYQVRVCFFRYCREINS